MNMNTKQWASRYSDGEYGLLLGKVKSAIMNNEWRDMLADKYAKKCI